MIKKVTWAMCMQYVRLCFVGCIGVLVQFMAFNLLRLWCSPVWAIQWAILLAVITNFYAHARLTFSQTNHPLSALWTRKGALFMGYSFVMLLVQAQWLRLGVYCFDSSVAVENAVMFAGMVWGSLLNYLFYQRFIWPNKAKLK